MITKIHKLLRKQLQRDLGLNHVPEHLERFIHSINTAYTEFENDRGLMERSIDISSREYNERTTELENAEERLTNLVETIPLGIMLIDCDGRISFANSVAEQIFGMPREKIVGTAYDDPLWRMCNVDGVVPAAAKLPLNLVLHTKEPIAGLEYSITSVTGRRRILYVNAAPRYDGQGQITGIVASLEDITLRKQMEEQLRYMSLHDSLTGLYNRAYFEEEMRRLGTSRHGSVGVIICDTDGLKLINDTLGHAQGDRLLLLTADLLKKYFRSENVVARIGGDEFAVLVTGMTQREVESRCHSLREAIEDYNRQMTDGLPFSISVGIAVSSEKNVIMADLFKEADNNMYREKLHHQHSVRSAIVQTLIKAMEARDFCTEGHADRMQDLAEELAREIGFPDVKIADLRLLAHFHDIGKVGIPDRLLFKPGPLTPDELIEMRRHCEIGHHIAQSAADLGPIADWILKHHEWWDGGGYPLGLKGEEIPLECRILAIADAYDAMTSDRPYRQALSREEAVAELQRCAGTQFDPELVRCFLNVVKKAQNKV